MAKWLYAGGKLYNTDHFKRIECRRIESNPEVWAVRAYYVDSHDYADLYTGDKDDTIQAQGHLARWLQAPDIDYF